MHNHNDHNRPINIDAPAPRNGIGAVLCRTPRPGPRDSWAACAAPSVENGDRSQMDEVGAILRRELFTACCDQLRIKLPAAEVDAYMAAMGLALSTLASHLLKTALRVAYSSTQSDSGFPPDLRAALSTTAERIASVDGDMAPALNLARMLGGIEGRKEETPQDRAERMLSSELISGCVILSALSGTADHRLHQLAGLLVGATGDWITQDMRTEREGGTNEEPR